MGGTPDSPTQGAHGANPSRGRPLPWPSLDAHTAAKIANTAHAIANPHVTDHITLRSIKTRMIDRLIAVIAVVLVIVIALALAAAGRPRAGGAIQYQRGRRHNRLCNGALVIDTLNFVFWRRSSGASGRQGSPDVDELIAAVSEAPRFRSALAERMRACGRAGDPGSPAAKLVFVAKEIWPPLGEEGWRRVAAAARAARANLEVAIWTERDPGRAPPPGDLHAAKGIDDFYAAFRAAEIGCVVASDDAFGDFASVTAAARPAVIWIFDAFADPGAPPTRQHLGAGGLSAARIQQMKPVTVRFDELFGRSESDERALARDLTTAAYRARKLAAERPAAEAPARDLADALDAARERADALADALEAEIIYVDAAPV